MVGHKGNLNVSNKLTFKHPFLFNEEIYTESPTKQKRSAKDCSCQFSLNSFEKIKLINTLLVDKRVFSQFT